MINPFAMKPSLVRFGVAMESPLLKDLDDLVEIRGVTRSEVLRDLVRAEVARAKIKEGAPCVASLTLVYDHHVRDLTERLTAMQHELGDAVRSTLHIHLDHDNCLEIIVLSGPGDRIRKAAERLLATRGVKQGGIEMIALPSIADSSEEAGPVHTHDGVPHRHPRSLAHKTKHSHSHEPTSK